MRITQTMIMYPSMDVLFLSLIFLSSPFIVLSADLIGYYDNIIISLGILSSFLLIKGQGWFILIIYSRMAFVLDSYTSDSRETFNVNI